jgi:hypothetical protein
MSQTDSICESRTRCLRSARLIPTIHRWRLDEVSLILQGFDPWQLLTLQKLQRSAAAGAYVRDLVAYAGLVDGAY